MSETVDTDAGSAGLSRRRLLKTAGLGLAGAVGAGLLPVMEAQAAAPSDASTQPPVPGVRPALRAKPALASTPGLKYKSIGGQAFKPINSSQGWQYSAFGGISAAGTTGQMSARFELPHGALISECTFYLLRNDANSMNGLIAFAAIDGSGFESLIFGTVPPQSSSVQAVPMTISSPILVDNTTYTYDVRCNFGTAGITQSCQGVRIGYVNEPGLVSFPNPRRVFGNFSTTPSGTTTAAIDAKTQIPDAPFSGAPSGVPAGAQAAYCAVMSYQSGVMTLYPDGTADPGIGNFTAQGSGGLLTISYGLVPLNPMGFFRLHTYFSGQIFVDVWGYLM